MITSKTRSAKIVGIRPITPLSVVAKHLSAIGFHVERSYGWVSKPREPKIFKIGHSPARHLLPNHVNMELQVIYRKIEGKS